MILSSKQPLVGVALIIIKENQHILLGQRLGAHGHLTWGLPGGHLEYLETPEDCAVREMREETGLEIANLRRGPWSHDIFAENQRQYITIFMLCDYVGGEAQVLEPQKCQQWAWFDWHHMPAQLFQSIPTLIAQGYDLEKMQSLFPRR